MVISRASAFFKECRGLGLDRRIQPGGDNLSARRLVRALRRVRRHDIQQNAGNAGVGKVGGDARAHGPGAQHGDLIDPLMAGFLALALACVARRWRWGFGWERQEQQHYSSRASPGVRWNG